MMHRMVNGEKVLMSDEEEAAILFEREAEEVPNAIKKKLDELKTEGISRLAAVGIKDIDTLKLIREFWLSIAPAAKQATVPFQSAIDIYQAAANAIIDIKNMTDTATIEAYDVTTDPSWPQ